MKLRMIWAILCGRSVMYRMKLTKRSDGFVDVDSLVEPGYIAENQFYEEHQS